MIRIGRDPSNDVVINDPLVSRFHVELTSDGFNNCVVRDMNSSNGTFVNGRRIAGTAALMDNDVLKIGNTIVPWKRHLGLGGATTINDISANNGRVTDPGPAPKEKKTINWRNVLTIISTIVGVMVSIGFLLSMILRICGVF